MHKTIIEHAHDDNVQDTLKNFRIVEITDGKIIHEFRSIPECDEYYRRRQ